MARTVVQVYRSGSSDLGWAGDVVQAGNDNPDGFSTTGTVYLARDYNTENAAHVLEAAPSAACDWDAAFGRGSSGGWRTM